MTRPGHFVARSLVTGETIAPGQPIAPCGPILVKAFADENGAGVLATVFHGRSSTEPALERGIIVTREAEAGERYRVGDVIPQGQPIPAYVTAVTPIRGDGADSPGTYTRAGDVWEMRASTFRITTSTDSLHRGALHGLRVREVDDEPTSTPRLAVGDFIPQGGPIPDYVTGLSSPGVFVTWSRVSGGWKASHNGHVTDERAFLASYSRENELQVAEVAEPPAARLRVGDVIPAGQAIPSYVTKVQGITTSGAEGACTWARLGRQWHAPGAELWDDDDLFASYALRGLLVVEVTPEAAPEPTPEVEPEPPVRSKRADRTNSVWTRFPEGWWWGKRNEDHPEYALPWQEVQAQGPLREPRPGDSDANPTPEPLPTVTDTDGGTWVEVGPDRWRMVGDLRLIRLTLESVRKRWGGTTASDGRTHTDNDGDVWVLLPDGWALTAPGTERPLAEIPGQAPAAEPDPCEHGCRAAVDELTRLTEAPEPDRPSSPDGGDVVAAGVSYTLNDPYDPADGYRLRLTSDQTRLGITEAVLRFVGGVHWRRHLTPGHEAAAAEVANVVKAGGDELRLPLAMLEITSWSRDGGTHDNPPGSDQ